MHGLITASAGDAWSYGGSILTFVFPMLLFVGVAAALYVLYTKPHLVPGHRYHMDGRSVPAPPTARTPGQSGPSAPQETTAGHGPAAAAEGGAGPAGHPPAAESPEPG